MNDNIKLTIIGNYIYAKQTGPDSVECGDMPERGTYDKTTHIAVSLSLVKRLYESINGETCGDELCEWDCLAAELRAALGWHCEHVHNRH